MQALRKGLHPFPSTKRIKILNGKLQTALILVPAGNALLSLKVSGGLTLCPQKPYLRGKGSSFWGWSRPTLRCPCCLLPASLNSAALSGSPEGGLCGRCGLGSCYPGDLSAATFLEPGQ